MPRHIVRLGIVVLLLLATGCARVTIYEGDGTISVDDRFGVIRISAEPGTKPMVVQTDGIGVISHGGAVTVGYHSSNQATLPADDCRIVVWLDEKTKPEDLDILTKLKEPVCRIGPGASKMGGKK